MKNKYILIGLFLLISNMLLSQVGINTPDPKATLDVKKNATTVSKPPGLIAPRLTGDQIKALNTNYTLNQKGAIVYATSAVTQPNNDPKTEIITTACYYYFDGVKWISLGACTDSVYGSDVIKIIYNGTAPDPTKTVAIGNYRFRFGSGTNAQPQISLISAPVSNKNVYIGFNQQYQTNGFQYRNFTTLFTPANFATYQNVASDSSNDIVDFELNIAHIVDIEANSYYRVTFYISGPSSGSKTYIIEAEKF